MPELPEVEYVARQLRDELVGRHITGVEVLWPPAISGMDPAAFAAQLIGRTIVGIDRRAKYLALELDDGHVLTIHRRMSGNLILTGPDERDPYARVVFTLDDGRRLVFSDPRKFGRIVLISREQLPALFSALGPEPLAADFTPAVLSRQLAGRNRAIKALLLDQSVVAGLGNIYADEALFRAGLHPLRPGSSLTPAEVAALHSAIQETLRLGIEHGGTTFGRHRDAYNEAGRNLDYLNVYRRTGEPCRRCGTPIARTVVAQRGTHFCPRCQRLPKGSPKRLASGRARSTTSTKGRSKGRE
jgi:formamidopyrimidine-DNA glycosylase